MQDNFCRNIRDWFFAHFFILVNVIQNSDNINCSPFSAGAGISSGRWGLELINRGWHRIWGVYNIPFFNALLALILVSCAAYLIVWLFDEKNIVNCILIGGIMIAFPSITSMMFYSFTAPYYGLAICFSVIAVCLYKQFQFGFIISAICIAISMGIYQAYLPLTITLFVLFLLTECIRKEWGIIETLKKGIKSVSTILLGIIFYYVFLKFFLWYYDASLASYKGIDSRGKIEWKTLPALLKKMISNCILLYKNDYYSIAITTIVHHAIFVLMCGTLLFLIIYLILQKSNIGNIVSVLILGVFLMIAADSIEIMCPDNSYNVKYCLMMYGMSGLFIAPVILYEVYPEKGMTQICEKIKLGGEWLVTISITLIIINFVWQSNGNYMAGYYTTEQTVSYFQTLVTRIKSTEGYSPELPISFVGDFYDDESFSNIWTETPFWYGGHMPELINCYSTDKLMMNYLGYSYIPATEDEKKRAELKAKDMPNYPQDGSIKIIDGVIVVKRG